MRGSGAGHRLGCVGVVLPARPRRRPRRRHRCGTPAGSAPGPAAGARRWRPVALPPEQRPRPPIPPAPHHRRRRRQRPTSATSPGVRNGRAASWKATSSVGPAASTAANPARSLRCRVAPPGTTVTGTVRAWVAGRRPVREPGRPRRPVNQRRPFEGVEAEVDNRSPPHRGEEFVSSKTGAAPSGKQDHTQSAPSSQHARIEREDRLASHESPNAGPLSAPLAPTRDPPSVRIQDVPDQGRRRRRPRSHRARGAPTAHGAAGPPRRCESPPSLSEVATMTRLLEAGGLVARAVHCHRRAQGGRGRNARRDRRSPVDSGALRLPVIVPVALPCEPLGPPKALRPDRRPRKGDRHRLHQDIDCHLGTAPSSSGPGRRPFKPVTRVRIPSGLLLLPGRLGGRTGSRPLRWGPNPMATRVPAPTPDRYAAAAPPVRRTGDPVHTSRATG